MSGDRQHYKLTTGDEKLETESEETSQGEVERLAEEKKLVQKLDRRILPIACLLYLFACWSALRSTMLRLMSYSPILLFRS